jgi:hypothetical protein
MKKEYNIPDYKYSDFLEKIEKMNRRAARLNLSPIVIKKTGDFLQKQGKFTYKVYTVIIEGESPKIDNWIPVCQLEHLESGNIIKNFTDFLIPEEYRKVESYCEHCNKSRVRNFTYILYNDQINVYKQIGSTCIKDFTGWPNAEDIAAYYGDFF